MTATNTSVTDSLWRNRHSGLIVPDRAPRGRLLLITYGFPPDLSVGARRWQKLARFASERGWGLDVVTLDPAELDHADPSGLAELPQGIRIIGVRHGRSAWLRAHRRLSALRARQSGAHGSVTPSCPADYSRRAQFSGPMRRAYLATIDYAHYARWARDAAAVALRLVEPGIHHAVVTSGPPHMAHETGRIVSRRCRLPHVVDMRDLWSLVERLSDDVASPVRFGLATHYERRVMANAALVIANTDRARSTLCAHYPEATQRIVTVMNGWDEDAVPPPPRPRSDRFVVAFAGSIYLDHDPRLLFRAAARVVRELDLAPTDFGLEFMGHVASYRGLSLHEMAAEEGVVEFVVTYPVKPRANVQEFLARSAVLVSLQQDGEMAIPAKIFEYMLFPAWLLALASCGSATELLLRGTAADVVAPHDVDEMTRVLRSRFLQFRAGVRPLPLAQQHRSFSRRQQACILFDALDRCLASVGRIPAG